MAICDPTGALDLRGELGLNKTAAAKGVTTNTDGTWSIWTAFCRDLACDPFLQNITSPMPLLQIFASQYRVGTLAPSHSPVKSRTVEAALRTVGQTFAALGHQDPRLQPSGKLDFWLQRQLQSYKKTDPPPTRVKPIPLQIIHHVILHCYRTPDPRSNAIGQMIILGFFFLLRLGEYAHTNNPEAAPFCLCDVHLLRYNVRIDALRCAEELLTSATHVALEFTMQKNGVRGELVMLGRSGHHILCPVLAAIARLKHLRLHQAHPTTHLYQYYNGRSWQAVNTYDLTQNFHAGASTLGHTVGIQAADISVRSLRSSGAMALLCADVDSDKICLLG